MMSCLEILSSIDVSGALFLVMLLIGAFVLMRLDRARGNTLRVADFFVDRHGHADKYALGYLLVCFVMTWATWYLTVHDRLTEWYVTIFVGGFVLGAGAKTAAVAFGKKDVDQPDAGTVRRVEQRVEETTVKPAPTEK